MLRELKKALSQTEQPARTIYTAKEVYDTSQLEFIRETTCAAVVGENGRTDSRAHTQSHTHTHAHTHTHTHTRTL